MVSIILDRGVASEKGMKRVKTDCAIRRIPVLVAITLLGSPVALGATDDGAAALSAASLVNTACTQCHGLSTIASKVDGGPGWTETVKDMVMRGAQLNESEMKIVVTYLVGKYGPGAGLMRTNLPSKSSMAVSVTASSQLTLPDGTGKTLVEGYCSACHDLGRIAASEMNEPEWSRTIHAMVKRMGGSITDTDTEVMAAYLAANFGRRESAK